MISLLCATHALGTHCLDYSVWAGYCVFNTVSLGAFMFKNETERAFVLVMLMCGFIFLWIVVKDVAFAS